LIAPQPTWRPPLLWIYIFAIFLASLGVVVYLFLSHREKSELNAHHAAFSRNIAFGLCRRLFALCTSLVAESESLSLLTAPRRSDAAVFCWSSDAGFWFSIID